MTALLKTPLYDWHTQNGVKMAPFSGYLMPIEYHTRAMKEALAVRNTAGLFDISHMRPIFITGPNALRFLNYIATRDLSTMSVGDARYSLVCDGWGAPLDDVIIYRLTQEKFLLVANAGNGERVFNHLTRIKNAHEHYNNYEVRLEDGFGQYGFISLQGPNAKKIIEKAVRNPSDIPEKGYTCGEIELFCGFEVFVAKTGYTGEEGFEILCKEEQTLTIWQNLLALGSHDLLFPCGLGARNILRLEAGMPLFGHELDREHGPYEAHLEKFVDIDTHRFIGQGSLRKKLEYQALKEREFLHGFTMPLKGRVAREECLIYIEPNDSFLIGKITSASPSPTLEKNIAMGYMLCELDVGTEVFVKIGEEFYSMQVSSLPFYKRAK